MNKPAGSALEALLAISKPVVGDEERWSELCEEVRVLAAADVVVGLTFGQTLFAAENLSFLASVDEGENTDFDELHDLSQFFYARLTEAAGEPTLSELVGEDGAVKLREAHGSE